MVKTEIESIWLSKDVKDITLVGLNSLRTLVIECNSLDYLSIMDCDNLTSIYFQGTEQQWLNTQEMGKTDFSKVTLFFNPEESIPYEEGEFTATVYYYRESQPTEEGNYWHYVEGAPTPW